ncbi:MULTISPECIES: SsgA family sporulation/cell division regulator [Kitasatospora]|uniref:Putative sporulation and cell division protein n=1 Tax=Kitasatospora setae (strain ATCC 33774 / DSM 43861 / JCM 3304 / KCC A-0304 / NBRC 14216 / KM-6054) TaxID=452652 RepID=E4N3C0_KITSK|nr:MULTISPECIES: SsgA family sporulation/cell division regulator [Kitasatospora]BAJ32654.1 putative sporulation and cell division protein [Kitasatospora setae KM-6054]
MGPVTERITLHLLAPDGTTVRLDTDWRYRPDDPYAVSLEFGPRAAGARWVLSREMLLASLHGPVGDGDIHFAPLDDGMLCLALGGAGGTVVLTAECAAIAAFLAATAELVPLGSESERIDWDGGLADLLSA